MATVTITYTQQRLPWQGTGGPTFASNVPRTYRTHARKSYSLPTNSLNYPSTHKHQQPWAGGVPFTFYQNPNPIPAPAPTTKVPQSQSQSQANPGRTLRRPPRLTIRKFKDVSYNSRSKIHDSPPVSPKSVPDDSTGCPAVSHVTASQFQQALTESTRELYDMVSRWSSSDESSDAEDDDDDDDDFF